MRCGDRLIFRVEITKKILDDYLRDDRPSSTCYFNEGKKKAIAKRLNGSKWTSQLVITAINARTGQLETINQQIGMDLIDSVAASGAVPGLWPHVTMNGKEYIDGEWFHQQMHV